MTLPDNLSEAIRESASTVVSFSLWTIGAAIDQSVMQVRSADAANGEMLARRKKDAMIRSMYLMKMVSGIHTQMVNRTRLNQP